MDKFLTLARVLNLANEVVSIEIDALSKMQKRIDINFFQAIEHILSVSGRLIILGMGKSGLIGRKLAATFSSTGTSSYFVHPGEAFHGDLGIIQSTDIVLMISYSGETEELIRLLPYMHQQQNKIIALTGKMNSTLAKHADAVLDVSVEREACNNNLAPTSSTTAALVMGDALAVVTSHLKNFQPKDFAKFHPGGSIGKRLLTTVADVMRTANLPIASPQTGFKELIQIISKGRLGLCIVMEYNQLNGVITDGDIRRTLEYTDNLAGIHAEMIMSKSPKCINQDTMLADAEDVMRSNQMNALIVVDAANNVKGVVRLLN